jgi:hypothetical protein
MPAITPSPGIILCVGVHPHRPEYGSVVVFRQGNPMFNQLLKTNDSKDLTVQS